MKTTIKSCLGILGMIVVLMLSGCGNNTKDYTEYFTITSIEPLDNDEENLLNIEYQINNNGKSNNLTFSVTINDIEEKYSIEAGTQKSSSVFIDIGRPEEYELEYPVSYKVEKNGKVIWSKDDTIEYDCTSMFVHTATLNYKNKSTQIQLIDYQSNFYDLSSMFDDFDTDVAHKVKITNSSYDRAFIQETIDSEKGATSAAVGNVLKLFTHGYYEINDTYRFSDNLIIDISDSVTAASVDWENNMEFIEDSDYSTSKVAGITVATFTMYVTIKNPSDEGVYGTITKFYVNDKAVSDNYLAASNHILIKACETEKLHNVSSASTWKTTGETNVNKFGMKVKLEDKDGNVLYDGIQWLILK